MDDIPLHWGKDKGVCIVVYENFHLLLAPCKGSPMEWWPPPLFITLIDKVQDRFFRLGQFLGS
jgi:hypothetical protein